MGMSIHTNVETRIVVMCMVACTDRFMVISIVGTALVEDVLEPEIEEVEFAVRAAVR